MLRRLYIDCAKSAITLWLNGENFDEFAEWALYLNEDLSINTGVFGWKENLASILSAIFYWHCRLYDVGPNPRIQPLPSSNWICCWLNNPFDAKQKAYYAILSSINLRKHSPLPHELHCKTPQLYAKIPFVKVFIKTPWYGILWDKKNHCFH